MYASSRLFSRLGKCVDLRDEFAGGLRQPVPSTLHTTFGLGSRDALSGDTLIAGFCSLVRLW